MLDPKIEAALNQQINLEIFAAYNYLAMTAFFEHASLKGFANWTKVQRLEELDHATRIFDYVHDRGGSIVLDAVPRPLTEYAQPIDVFAAALEQEQTNTRQINVIYKLAGDGEDFATQSFLQWFLDEQVEEERVVSEAVSLLERAGDNPSALLVLNEQFSTRTPDK